MPAAKGKKPFNCVLCVLAAVYALQERETRQRVPAEPLLLTKRKVDTAACMHYCGVHYFWGSPNSWGLGGSPLTWGTVL